MRLDVFWDEGVVASLALDLIGHAIVVLQLERLQLVTQDLRLLHKVVFCIELLLELRYLLFNFLFDFMQPVRALLPPKPLFCEFRQLLLLPLNIEVLVNQIFP